MMDALFGFLLGALFHDVIGLVSRMSGIICSWVTHERVRPSRYVWVCAIVVELVAANTIYLVYIKDMLSESALKFLGGAAELMRFYLWLLIILAIARVALLVWTSKKQKGTSGTLCRRLEDKGSSNGVSGAK